MDLLPDLIPILLQPAGIQLTWMRVWSTGAALIGLAGVVIGALSIRRGRQRQRGRARIAVLAGSTAVLGGVLNLVLADGGPGTGNGVVAGGLAVILGAVAIGLAIRVLRRYRTGVPDTMR